MSKMGISTIASYKGAQIFECLGMADEVVDACFVGTASRIAGVGYQTLAEDQMRVHGMAYGSKFMSASMADAMALPNPGDYHWRSVLPFALLDLPAMQSINQSVDWSVGQSISQSIKQSINQSIHPSIHLSVSWSINQSTHQSVNHPIDQ